MITCEVTVRTKKGIHARPASQIVQLSSKFSSKIHIIRENTEVNAKSIIGILTLGAIHREKLTLRIEGTDEQQAQRKLLELFEKTLV